MALVTWMPHLVTLGLHDTIVGLEDLLVLARCKHLASLSVSASLSTGNTPAPFIVAHEPRF